MSSVPDAAAPGAPTRAERMLRRDGAIVLAGLAALWGLTTVWLLSGAGLGMDIGDMTRMAWLPQHHASPRGDMAGMDMRYVFEPWTAARVALLAAMWWTMMVAMMTPSAAPAVLLYARVHRHAAGRGAVGATPPVAAFVAGYVVAWGGFAVAATALQLALHAGGVLSAMTMGLPGRGVAATVLVAAGVYQFTPWKDACLSRCRAPAAFLARHWRPGAVGALRLGLRHGAWCIGCCAPLMMLLFVGGVMNLVWIAVLTALVLAEKRLPHGRALGRTAGAALVVWGGWLAASGG